MVHGDGQQYLFDIAINMYWLKFLHEVNQLTNEILMNAIFGMNKGNKTVRHESFHLVIYFKGNKITTYHPVRLSN